MLGLGPLTFVKKIKRNRQYQVWLAERVAIEERLGSRQGQRTDLATSGNISPSDQGRTSDLAAKKTGF